MFSGSLTLSISAKQARTVSVGMVTFVLLLSFLPARNDISTAFEQINILKASVA
jgi:hypothetical protein